MSRDYKHYRADEDAGDYCVRVDHLLECNFDLYISRKTRINKTQLLLGGVLLRLQKYPLVCSRYERLTWLPLVILVTLRHDNPWDRVILVNVHENVCHSFVVHCDVVNHKKDFGMGEVGRRDFCIILVAVHHFLEVLLSDDAVISTFGFLHICGQIEENNNVVRAMFVLTDNQSLIHFTIIDLNQPIFKWRFSL